MIPRYTPADFAKLWSPATKYETWFDVELAACRAMERAGFVPAKTTESLEPIRHRIDPERIDEIERTTRHDVIAFLTHIEELAGPAARWLHRGMTSSDVLDTSFAILLRRACDSLIERLDSTRSAFRKRIEEHRRTPMIGRSHGIHAEPITFGLMLSSHLAELDRSRRHLHRAREEISVGKIAGAVGTYAHLTPEIESDALQQLDLAAETCATQIVARDRHASFFCALGVLASAIERFAVNIRHAQRTEVGEAEEAFAVGQKGSSAMPHKRNPVLSENLTGLARTVRMTVIPALENVALWHERDISHSSVERMIAPDATSTMAFALDRLHRLVEHLVVYPDRLANNLERSGGLWASEGVLLLLVSAGLPRQKSYELVQRNAMRAFHGEGDFKTLLAEDEDLMKHISFEELEQQFDLEHALRYVDPIIDRTLSASNPE